MRLTIEQLLNESNRLAAILQARLDTRAPWTPELRRDAETLRAITRELHEREAEQR